MSTDAPVSQRAGTPGGPAQGFDLDRPWRLDDRVAVRPEPFGALFTQLRGGCVAAKFFTGLPLDRPDPECAQGHGQAALQARGLVSAPRPAGDHSHRGPVRARAAHGRRGRTGPVPVIIGSRPSPASPPSPAAPPARACDAHPLAGFGSEASEDHRLVLDAAHTLHEDAAHTP